VTLKFASLGSGSEGNALLVSSVSGTASTTVMLDCGFGLRETERRLARLNLAPSDVSGIVVTHEHQDHVGGVFKLARRHRIPVWLSHGTCQAVKHQATGVQIHICRDGAPFGIGSLEILPYTVPHDAREPLQYVFSSGGMRLGVLTDAGHATRHLIDVLGGCSALVLECNHDTDMLARSDYPASLKRRIGGPYGHLSNEATAQILAAVDQSRLNIVVGAHLSRQNNSAALARNALMSALNSARPGVMIAEQDEGFDWMVPE
jgi:phosphoribosyl 1,2-cyclic phosphodiesterase